GDVARADIGELEHRPRVFLEMRAVAAGVAFEGDQLHFRLRIAEPVPGLRLGDDAGPVGRSADAQKRGGSGKQGAANSLHPQSSFVPRLRASDSSTVRSSGSPMSRRLSPSSIGIGLSETGAAAPLCAGGALTSPCRSFTRTTAL